MNDNGWTKNINSAPKNGTEVLFYGRWKPFDINEGGQKCVVMARWSTFRADGTQHEWMTGLGRLSSWNVEWTHWRDIPETPDDGIEEPIKHHPREFPQEVVDEMVKQWFNEFPRRKIYPDQLAKKLDLRLHQVTDAFILLHDQGFINEFIRNPE